MTYISKPSAALPLRLILAPLLGAWLATSAGRAADLDLPGGCATAGSASLHEHDGPKAGFEAGRLELLVPGLPAAPSMHAGHLQAGGAGAGLAPGQLEQASTAAAAALLAGLSGHHEGGCPDAVLRQASRPLAHALQAGGEASFTWSDVSIRSGRARYGARQLSLHLTGGPTARLDAVLDGLVGNGEAASLTPAALTLRVSVPAAELPGLLAGARGGPVQMTIERLHATRDDAVLDGHGQSLIGPDPQASAGEGELTAQGFDTLLAAAGAPGLERLHTGLFLARLVAHRDGDRLTWMVSWRGGTLMVNNVPIPMR